MKSARRTHRAGMDLKDPARSAYARTYVLGQDDLFPNEGYEFKPTAKPKRTKSYKVSEDSPFNNTEDVKVVKKLKEDKVIKKNRKDIMRTELLCTRTAKKAIAAPTPGELRPINSIIAAKAIQKERDEQIKLRQKLKVAKMQDEAYWEEVEQNEGTATLKINKAIEAQRHYDQKDLADDYRRQFAEHKKIKDEEEREKVREAERIELVQREEEQKERLRKIQLRELARERNHEFQLRNDELLQRKEKRIEDDIDNEKILAKQHAEVEQRMEERERLAKFRRDEKNRIRNELIDKQAKQLKELKEKQQRSDHIAESELTKREEARRRAEARKKKEMEKDRNREWLDYQRKKDTRLTDYVETPDFDTNDDDTARDYDAKIRKQLTSKLQKDQFNQMMQRRQQEQQALKDSRRKKDNMFFLKDNEW